MHYLFSPAAYALWFIYNRQCITGLSGRITGVRSCTGATVSLLYARVRRHNKTEETTNVPAGTICVV